MRPSARSVGQYEDLMSAIARTVSRAAHLIDRARFSSRWIEGTGAAAVATAARRKTDSIVSLLVVFGRQRKVFGRDGDFVVLRR